MVNEKMIADIGKIMETIQKEMAEFKSAMLNADQEMRDVRKVIQDLERIIKPYGSAKVTVQKDINKIMRDLDKFTATCSDAKKLMPLDFKKLIQDLKKINKSACSKPHPPPIKPILIGRSSKKGKR